MRPTDEQIKALRKGDVVTVRAEVVEVDGEFFVVSIWQNSMYGVRASITADSIVTIEPREIKVGDRVTIGTAGNAGVVKFFDDDVAFIRWDRGHYTCDFTTNLTVIP